jgi:protein-disulfide isomerase
VNYVTHLQNCVIISDTEPTTFTSINNTNNLKHLKMKKTIFLALLAIFSLSALPAFATKSSTKATETSTEPNSKLTAEEISTYRARVEEIRDMDKSEMTVSEKNDLKNEVKDIKATMHKDGVYLYVGGTTILIIILLLILL